jgi:hypothetical protein
MAGRIGLRPDLPLPVCLGVGYARLPNSYMAVEPYASPRRFAYEACTQHVADSAGIILMSL